MEGIPEAVWLPWKRKRRNTLIGFIIIGTAVGIDCSVILSTLYVYLRDMIKTDQPSLYYGLILAIFYLSSTIFGAVSGRWLDKTRKVRYYVNFSLLVQIIGFILYTIPYHPAFLLVGRAICGLGEPFTNVITGEIFRIYDNKGSTRAMLWLASIYSFGFIIGPSLNFLLKDIKFKIGPMEVNNLNVIGIFMAGLLLVVLILASFLVHDCSAELDLKEHLKRIAESKERAHGNANSKEIAHRNVNKKKISHEAEEEIEIDNSTEETNLIYKPPSSGIPNVTSKPFTKKTIPLKLVFKNLVSDIDVILIFVATFIFVYAVFGSCVVVPLIITKELGWGITTVSLTFVGYGIGYFILLIFMAKYCTENRSIYYATIISISSIILMNCSLICLKLLERNYKRDVGLLVMFVFTSILAWCAEDVLVRIMLAKRIPSVIQSFSETLRAGVTKIAYTVGALTVPLFEPYLRWWSGVIILILGLLLLGFVLRRKSFIYPEEITFIEDKAAPFIGVNYGAVETPDL